MGLLEAKLWEESVLGEDEGILTKTGEKRKTLYTILSLSRGVKEAGTRLNKVLRIEEKRQSYFPEDRMRRI